MRDHSTSGMSCLFALAMCFLAPRVSMAQRAVTAAGDPSRIARIEHGLLPSVAIEGQPLPAMNLADRMKFYRVPGVSVAFFDQGRIAWTRAYGVADTETGRPVTAETLFQAGSISKPIAALGALSLVQRGKLSLDANVNSELTTWKLKDNEFTAEQKVTLRKILSHSAGINVHGFSGYEAGQPRPSVVQILNGEPPANSPAVQVTARPGSVYSYSGGGFMVMQLMMMDATSKPFPDLMHDLVLRPIGMSHSTYAQPLPDGLKGSAAHGYEASGKPLPGGAHVIPEMAAGGLWSTPSDLALAAIAVQNAYAGRSNKVLSQSMAREMLSRQKDNWGLGFEIEKPGATPRFDHFGVNAGFVSVLQAYRDLPQGIVIMTNGQQGEKLITEILRAVAQEYGWPDFQPAHHTLVKVSPDAVRTLAGTYAQRDPDGQDRLTVTVRDGRAYLAGSYSVGSTSHFTLSDPVELLPEATQQFFTLQTGLAQFRFVTDAKGIVDRCVVVSGGNEREAFRVTP